MGGFFSAQRKGRKSALVGAPWELVGADDTECVDSGAPSSSQFQMFVRIYGQLISVQVTRESTVESAIYSAFSQGNYILFKFGAHCWDAVKQRRLLLEESLEGVVPGSTITTFAVIHGGGPGKPYLQQDYMSFLDRMNELPSKNEWLETKGLTSVLSKLGRQTFHKLFEMISLYHTGNKCFVGKFDCNNIIYVPSTDSYMIDPYVLALVVDFTPSGYKEDIKALGKVLEKVCMMKLDSSQAKIAYVAHLLKTMREMPSGAESSQTFKAFIRNHPCMMSSASRQGLISEVHRYIKFQYDDSMEPVLQSPYTWGWIAECDRDFNPVYLYKWRLWPLRGTGYYENEWSWFTFCRNFLSHPNQNLTIQDADIAIWWYFDEHLADFLCRLSCTHEFKFNIFDKDSFCTHPAKWERYPYILYYESVPNLEYSTEESEYEEEESEYAEEVPDHSEEKPSPSEIGRPGIRKRIFI
ncbi:hypothetical protein CFC21_055649 [Triticum aestivum]|uniref:Uncharacterized protein n=2 Tax=Triticum aestivum TaxID=4565 RepID=A0A3B6I326_WHEAT|nr:uncharacterized protein LOC123084531 [Triticum aestivum]KAF7046631.1 hypothetical protein CFC21_055649 [Triticum aestivum]